MEPFTIHCETCAARLKVRNASAIGQRLACPKCDRMILVKAPDGWELPEEPSGSTAKTSEGNDGEFADIDSILQQKEKQQAARKTAHQAGQTSQTRKQKPTQKKTANPNRGTATKQQSSDSEPLLPNDNWVGASTQKRRRNLMLGIGVVGLLLMISAIVLAIAANKKSGDQVSSEDGNNSELVAPDKAVPDTDEPQPEKSTPVDESNQPENPSKEDERSEDANPADTLEPNDVTSVEPVSPEPEPSENQPLETKDELPASADPDSPEVPAPDPPTLPTDDPTNPPNPSTKSPFGSDLDDILNDSQPAADVDSSFDDFSTLLENNNSTVSELNQLADIDADRRRIGIPKYFFKKPQTLDTRNFRRLQDGLAGAQYQDQSLLTVIAEISQITGVPISFDVDNLVAAGFDFEMRIDSLQMKNTNFKQVIDQLLSNSTVPLALVYDGNSPAVITTADEANSPGQLQQASIPTPKLHSRTPDEFAQLLTQMVAPQSWTNEEASLTVINDELQIKNDAVVVHLIKAFVEAWQLASDSTSGNRDAATLQSRSAKFSQQRANPVNLALTYDQPIGSFLNRLGRDANVSILIDYPTLLQNGWSQQTMVPAEVNEPDLGQVLDEMEHAMEISVRVVNANTIELTDAVKISERLDVEFHDCSRILPKPIDAIKLVELVQGNLAASGNNNPNLRVLLEEELQCLIVVGPQTVQRRLETFLQKLSELK